MVATSFLRIISIERQYHPVNRKCMGMAIYFQHEVGIIYCQGIALYVKKKQLIV